MYDSEGDGYDSEGYTGMTQREMDIILRGRRV